MCVITYKVLHDLVPSYLFQIISFHIPSFLSEPSPLWPFSYSKMPDSSTQGLHTNFKVCIFSPPMIFWLNSQLSVISLEAIAIYIQACLVLMAPQTSFLNILHTYFWSQCTSSTFSPYPNLPLCRETSKNESFNI